MVCWTGDVEQRTWVALKARIGGRIEAAGSLTAAFGARDFSHACNYVNDLFARLAESYPDVEMIENLRLFLIDQLAGEFALRASGRAFIRRHGLRVGEVPRRRRARQQRPNPSERQAPGEL